jgi:ADP-ribose pyrophosphatase
MCIKNFYVVHTHENYILKEVSIVDIKVIDKQSIYKGRIIDLFVEKVMFPAREVAMECIHHPGGAAVVPLFPDKTVALIQQYRYCMSDAIWEIPAGRLEQGEEPLGCAKRELEEEVGYKAVQMRKLTDIYSAPAYCTEVISIFLAQDLIPARQQLDDDEIIKVVRLPLTEAIEKVIAGEIRDAKTVVGLLLTCMSL